MNLLAQPRTKSARSGQTLIVALIVLGILLVLGFVFLGIVNRSVLSGGRQQQRSEATDLAEAGIRFAHEQMLNSPLGADWAPNPTPANANDPDIDLVQPGGPDGLGAYSRVEFERGRALIRLKYAPSSEAVARNTPEGNLRKPGKARNYLMIESIGRPGRLPVGIGSDPTLRVDRSKIESRKQVAFVSIGLIETARFITNKFNSNRPIEIGAPRESGVTYNNNPVSVPSLVGTSALLLNRDGSTTTRQVGLGGSLWANGDVRLHGEILANLNAALGDFWGIAGGLSPADNTATLRIAREDVDNAGNWAPAENFTLTGANLDSRNGGFSTVRGVLRDGLGRTDAQGFARSLRRKDPPSILRVDPETGTSRYVTLTRNSGAVLATGNAGRFGHGQGVYVNNSSDRQIGRDEEARQDAGSTQSLVYDWLNPNNSQPNSGWQGAFYVPRGAYVLFTNDGFYITRDSRASDREKYWRVADGRFGPVPGGDPDNPTPSTTARYRLRKLLVGGELKTYVLNTYTLNTASDTTIDINSNLSDADFLNFGVPFNGVLYFEGNVRVRGVIPTDEQIQLVTNATAYIEGSIVRGIVGKGDQVLPGDPSVSAGDVLNRPSRSNLMIAARQYVALNTSQFFGPAASAPLEEANEVAGGVDWNPVRMRVQGGSLAFRSELVLDRDVTGGNPFNPTTWRPFANAYTELGAPANNVPVSLLLAHTMEDGAAPTTFFSLDVNAGLANPAYRFQLTDTNSATPFYLDLGAAVGSFQPIYGLGSEPYQRFSKFEVNAFPMVDDTFNYVPATQELNANTTPQGDYRLLANAQNTFTWNPANIGSSPTNDYLLARAAMNPTDVRIEATIFAEEGSFFVIPGPWFNPNPNDRRDVWQAAVDRFQNAPFSLPLDQARVAANEERLTNFGTNAFAPFYGEPLAVRVRIEGAVSENMPPPIAEQNEWLKKWGWMPLDLGSTGRAIPAQHVRDVPSGFDPTANRVTPNVTISYDPVLATGRTTGFLDVANNSTLVRYRWEDVNGNGVLEDNEKRALPPIPRLPVSPTLAYFGDER